MIGCKGSLSTLSSWCGRHTHTHTHTHAHTHTHTHIHTHTQTQYIKPITNLVGKLPIDANSMSNEDSASMARAVGSDQIHEPWSWSRKTEQRPPTVQHRLCRYTPVSHICSQNIEHCVCHTDSKSQAGWRCYCGIKLCRVEFAQ